MSLNYCVLGIDQTPPPSLTSLTHPPSPPTLSLYISTCFIFIPPYCLLPPSLRLSLSVLYASLCCRSPPSVSVCFIFISLLSLPPFSPLSLSLSLSERLLILMCLSSSLPPYLPSSTFFFTFLLLLISFLLHYLYLSLGLYPSSLLSLNLPSICLHLYLFSSSLSSPLSAAVQYSSITVVLIIPFSACSHTVIYQINNPSFLLILCLPTPPPLVSFLTVPSEDAQRVK